MDQYPLLAIIFILGLALAANVRGAGHFVGRRMGLTFFRIKLLRSEVGQIRAGRVIGTFLACSALMAGAAQVLTHGSRAPTTLDDVLIVALGLIGIAAGATVWRLSLPGGPLARL